MMITIKLMKQNQKLPIDLKNQTSRIALHMLFNKNLEIVKSRAKINLSLKIVNTREDGYHDVKMVMQTLNLMNGV